MAHEQIAWNQHSIQLSLGEETALVSNSEVYSWRTPEVLTHASQELPGSRCMLWCVQRGFRGQSPAKLAVGDEGHIPAAAEVRSLLLSTHAGGSAAEPRVSVTLLKI